MSKNLIVLLRCSFRLEYHVVKMQVVDLESSCLLKMQVLDRDSKNVGVLVQRALLYESTEKYKLGAEDLRMAMKIDPGNRVARGTLHRLTKLADYS